MVIAVSKGEGADVDPADLLDEHGVPERGGVIRCVDPKPGSARVPVLDQARVVELSGRGDVTGVGVDEERAHGPRG